MDFSSSEAEDLDEFLAFERQVAQEDTATLHSFAKSFVEGDGHTQRDGGEGDSGEGGRPSTGGPEPVLGETVVRKPRSRSPGRQDPAPARDRPWLSGAPKRREDGSLKGDMDIPVTIHVKEPPPRQPLSDSEEAARAEGGSARRGAASKRQSGGGDADSQALTAQFANFDLKDDAYYDEEANPFLRQISGAATVKPTVQTAIRNFQKPVRPGPGAQDAGEACQEGSDYQEPYGGGGVEGSADDAADGDLADSGRLEVHTSPLLVPAPEEGHRGKPPPDGESAELASPRDQGGLGSSGNSEKPEFMPSDEQPGQQAAPGIPLGTVVRQGAQRQGKSRFADLYNLDYESEYREMQMEECGRSERRSGGRGGQDESDRADSADAIDATSKRDQRPRGLQDDAYGGGGDDRGEDAFAGSGESGRSGGSGALGALSSGPLSPTSRQGTVVHIPQFIRGVLAEKLDATQPSDNAQHPATSPGASPAQRGPSRIPQVPERSRGAADDSREALVDKQLLQLELEINRLQKASKDLEEQKAKMYSEYSTRLSTLGRDREEFEKHRSAEMARLRKERESLNERRTLAKNREDTSRQLKADLDKANGELNVLRAQLKKKDADARLGADTLRAKLDTANAELMSLKRSLEARDKEVVALRAEKQELAGALAAERRRADELERKLQRAPREAAPGERQSQVSNQGQSQPQSQARPTGQSAKPRARPATGEQAAPGTPGRRPAGPKRPSEPSLDDAVQGGPQGARSSVLRGDAAQPASSSQRDSRADGSGSPSLLSNAPQRGRKPSDSCDAAIRSLTPFASPADLRRSFAQDFALLTDGIAVVQSADSEQKKEYLLKNGVKYSVFLNGTVKVSSPDRRAYIKFNNGDLKLTFADGRAVYYYEDVGTLFTTLPISLLSTYQVDLPYARPQKPSDGQAAESALKIYNFSTGQVEHHWPDGTKDVLYPDGIRKLILPDGSERALPDQADRRAKSSVAGRGGGKKALGVRIGDLLSNLR